MNIMICMALTGGLVLAAMFSGAVPASAHGGGLNSQGCHNKTSDGTYHCHR